MSEITTGPGDSPAAHFVPLSQILESHDGQLESYMRAADSRNVVITMQVTMEVAGKKGKRFFVALGSPGILTVPNRCPMLLLLIARKAANACLHGCRRTALAVMISESILMISGRVKHCRMVWLPRSSNRPVSKRQ